MYHSFVCRNSTVKRLKIRSQHSRQRVLCWNLAWMAPQCQIALSENFLFKVGMCRRWLCALLSHPLGKETVFEKIFWGPATLAPVIYRSSIDISSLNESKICFQDVSHPTVFHSDKIALYSISFHLAKIEFYLIIKNWIMIDNWSRLSSCRQGFELNIYKIVSCQPQGNLNS